MMLDSALGYGYWRCMLLRGLRVASDKVDRPGKTYDGLEQSPNESKSSDTLNEKFSFSEAFHGAQRTR